MNVRRIATVSLLPVVMPPPVFLSMHSPYVQTPSVRKSVKAAHLIADRLHADVCKVPARLLTR